MKIFLYTVQLPEQVFGDRVIKSVVEKTADLLRLNEKELNRYYSGEFGWKKLASNGVCAIQYINKSTVRLVVSAINADAAEGIVKSYAWHLDAKAKNKGPYVRRCSTVRRMEAANTIAITAAIKATG